MRRSHSFPLLAVSFVFVLLISTIFALGVGDASAGLPTPEDVIADALARARAQDGYHLVADIQNTLIPQANPANRGTRDQTTSMRIIGDVAQNTHSDGSEDPRARLQFYAAQGESPVELLLSGNEAYVGYRDRWQQVEEPGGGVAPGGDYLGYLVAVHDVAEQESAVTAEGSFRRFSFKLDGERYAEYQRQRMERLLANRLPQGVELQASPVLEAMSGQGELWLDNKGLPRRHSRYLLTAPSQSSSRRCCLRPLSGRYTRRPRSPLPLSCLWWHRRPGPAGSPFG